MPHIGRRPTTSRRPCCSGSTSARPASSPPPRSSLRRRPPDQTPSPVSGVVECEWPESFVGCVDFSLMRPRGHYTRTPELTRFFLGMSMLGQEGFPSRRRRRCGARPAGEAVLVDDPALLADWTAIYEPTAFLVGLADDMTRCSWPTQRTPPCPVGATTRRSWPGCEHGGDRRHGILAAHPAPIDPERAGVRLMGAGFTLDSYVLDQLAWPNVGAPAERRMNVSALDLAAAFGSPMAREMQLVDGEGAFSALHEQLDTMTGLVADRTPDDWAGTVYDAWLAPCSRSSRRTARPTPTSCRPMRGRPRRSRRDSPRTPSSSTTPCCTPSRDRPVRVRGRRRATWSGARVEPDPVVPADRRRGRAASRRLRSATCSHPRPRPLGTLIELGTSSAARDPRLAGDVATDTENARLTGSARSSSTSGSCRRTRL